MNVKKEVIDQMRAISSSKDLRATSCMLENWVNTLEQDEQQTPPSPDGRGCAGESSVQPAAYRESLIDELNTAIAEIECDIEWLRKQARCLRARRDIHEKALQIEQEAKC